MGRNYGGWYRDKAINNIDARLALEGAGAGAKAVGALAKIPLDIDDRAMKQQALDAASSSANSRLSVAEINAKAKVVAAELGLKGKEVTAFSRQYVANAGRANNINTNNDNVAARDHALLAQANKHGDALILQKEKNKVTAKSPTEQRKYDGEGNLLEKTVKEAYTSKDFNVYSNKDLDLLKNSVKKK